MCYIWQRPFIWEAGYQSCSIVRKIFFFSVLAWSWKGHTCFYIISVCIKGWAKMNLKTSACKKEWIPKTYQVCLESLHLLLIHFRMESKILLIIFKAFNGLAPSYGILLNCCCSDLSHPQLIFLIQLFIKSSTLFCSVCLF